MPDTRSRHLRQWIGRTEEASESSHATGQGPECDAVLLSASQAGTPRRSAGMCLAQPVLSDGDAGAGRIPRAAVLPPVRCRAMWAAGNAIIEPLRSATRRAARAHDVTVKTLDRTLCFVSVEHTISPRAASPPRRQDSSIATCRARKNATRRNPPCAATASIVRHAPTRCCVRYSRSPSRPRIHYDRDPRPASRAIRG